MLLGILTSLLPFAVSTIVTQSPAEHGLDQISHHTPTPNPPYNYIYDDSACESTCAYVIDTGCRSSHEQFRKSSGSPDSRVLTSVNCVGASAAGTDCVVNNSQPAGLDDNGHGTHVSGTIGGLDYGVCKKTNLICVKVLAADGSGSIDDIVKGIEWAIADKKTNRPECTKGSAINMSLGGNALLALLSELMSPNSTTAKQAVDAAVAADLFVAIAAGNSMLPAGTETPANVKNACTVGAANADNSPAYFSDFGPIIDVYGPGVNVTSAYNTNDTATGMLSGTSMATPHICALGLYLNSLCPMRPGNSRKNPVKLCEYMRDNGTPYRFLGLIQLYTVGYNGGIDPCENWNV